MIDFLLVVTFRKY